MFLNQIFSLNFHLNFSTPLNTFNTKDCHKISHDLYKLNFKDLREIFPLKFHKIKFKVHI
jgi:hypothetical protein